VESNALIKINKLHINDNMSYVCYTSHAKFTYKGTQNDDIAVYSCVLEKSECCCGDDVSRWKVIFGQRSNGRSPNEALPFQ